MTTKWHTIKNFFRSLRYGNHTCPRRAESWGHHEMNADTWMKDEGFRKCTYCGSVHPEDFEQFAHDVVVEGGKRLKLKGTQKGYKFYLVAHPSYKKSGKFYTQHLTKKQYDDSKSIVLRALQVTKGQSPH